jgi:translation initiation factor eIF-2B subunit beta
VGNRLVLAQPREMVVGNIVRRVLGLIREIIDQKDEADESMSEGGSSTPQEGLRRPKLLPSHISSLSPLKHGATQPADPTTHDDGITTPMSDASSTIRRPPLLTSHTSFAPGGAPTVTSLFGLFSQPGIGSATSTPPNFANSPTTKPVSFADKIFRVDASSRQDNIKADVIEGIKEILDELDVVDEQISQYALENIHSDEIILTHTSSLTIQRFLLTAARKRKFTVIHVESYPNDSKSTHDVILHGAKKDVAADDDEDGEQERFKPLTEAGIKVIMIPDSAVFAIMSRVNKVILATHSVLANGGLVAAAGAKMIAQAAQAHQTPVVVLTGIYKLSPIYPFDVDELIEWGDAGAVARYEDAEFVEKVDVVNPVFDYVPPELVDLYISNL